MTAQDNPYESLGIETKVLTLSNGKYQEFFPNDTLVPIGNVMLNTITGEVTAILEVDTLYSEYSLAPEVVSRFLSLDPLAVEFPQWSPYNYTFNNPVRFIDPDGRAPEDIIVTISASDENNFGHAAIAIELYDDDGNKTGNVAVFHLAPAPEEGQSALEKAAILDSGVTPDYSISVQSTESFLSENQKSADGVIRLETTQEQDAAVASSLKGTAESQAEYEPANNNCASYVCGGLSQIMNTDNIGNETASASVMNGLMTMTRTFKTPNQLYNDLSKQSNAEVLKSAGNKTNFKFQKYIDKKMEN